MATDPTGHIAYDPITGQFSWAISGKGRRSGGLAGSLDHEGYWRLFYQGKTVRAPRMAYFIMIGAWPDREVDHINANRADNRWCNLRLATTAQNNWNRTRPQHNKSGYKGVHWSKKSRKWKSQIKVNGESIYLGLFDDPKEAHAAYVAAAEKHFGAYMRAA